MELELFYSEREEGGERPLPCQGEPDAVSAEAQTCTPIYTRSAGTIRL